MEDSSTSTTDSFVDIETKGMRQIPIREIKPFHQRYLELAADPEMKEYKTRFYIAGKLVDLTVPNDDGATSGSVCTTPFPYFQTPKTDPGAFRDIFYNSTAPLSLIDITHGSGRQRRMLIMSFDAADAAAQNSPFQSYFENPVYPFRPNLKYKDHDQWLRSQARDAGILVQLDKAPFDIRLVDRKWVFPEVELEEASKSDIENGECILCCAKSSDMSTGGISLYHETLAWFARTLMGRVPLSVKTGYRFSGTIDVYKSYKYFFNVVTFPPESNSVESEGLLRRFACNHLQEGVAVELIMEENQHPPMIWETEAEVKKQGGQEFLVRLPGVEFECDDHEMYSKAFIYWVRYQPAVLGSHVPHWSRQVRSR